MFLLLLLLFSWQNATYIQRVMQILTFTVAEFKQIPWCGINIGKIIIVRPPPCQQKDGKLYLLAKQSYSSVHCSTYPNHRKEKNKHLWAMYGASYQTSYFRNSSVHSPSWSRVAGAAPILRFCINIPAAKQLKSKQWLLPNSSQVFSLL